MFGFDQDQKKGTVWKRHRAKLLEILGTERVLLKGNSKEFRSGISS